MLDWANFRRYRLMRRLDSPDVDIRKKTLRKLADEGAPAASDSQLVNKLLELTIGPADAVRRESRYTLERIGVSQRTIFRHLASQLDRPEVRDPEDEGVRLRWVSELLSNRARPRGVLPLLRTFHGFVDVQLDRLTSPNGDGSHTHVVTEIEISAAKMFAHVEALRTIPSCEKVFTLGKLPPPSDQIDRYLELLAEPGPPSVARILAALGLGQSRSRRGLQHLNAIRDEARAQARGALDAAAKAEANSSADATATRSTTRSTTRSAHRSARRVTKRVSRRAAGRAAGEASRAASSTASQAAATTATEAAAYAEALAAAKASTAESASRTSPQHVPLAVRFADAIDLSLGSLQSRLRLRHNPLSSD